MGCHCGRRRRGRSIDAHAGRARRWLGLSAISPWRIPACRQPPSRLAPASISASLLSWLRPWGISGGRLRTKWTAPNTNEMFFRDTAHGFIAWAFATVLSAGVLGTATTHFWVVRSQCGGGAGAQAAPNINPAEIYVDRLFRAEAAAQPGTVLSRTAGNADAVRAETLRLRTSGFRDNGFFRVEDRTYLARLVAARTG